MRNLVFKENDIRCTYIFSFSNTFFFRRNLHIRNLALLHFQSCIKSETNKRVNLDDNARHFCVSDNTSVWWGGSFSSTVRPCPFCLSRCGNIAFPRRRPSLPPLSNDSLICVFRYPNVQGPNTHPKSIIPTSFLFILPCQGLD